jgi:hypothetical protein
MTASSSACCISEENGDETHPALPDGNHGFVCGAGARADASRPAGAVHREFGRQRNRRRRAAGRHASADAAKHTPQVDERDKLPIMARVLELNDQQHRLIAQSVGANAPRSDVKLSVEPVVTGLIPQTVPLSDLPANVLNEIPAAIPYKYAIVDNRILLVDPVNSYMVIDIIAR